MSDDDTKRELDLENRAYELASLRIVELYHEPIKGSFDAKHLRAVHAYIFQDSPQHRPGTTRDDTAETWIKHRALEGERAVYDVPYLSRGIGIRIAEVLQKFGGPDAIRDATTEAAAAQIAQLYGDLDHAHSFYEGNSRTLREFTRELALEAGFELDWAKTGVGRKERNELYIARDLAVLERAYPGLTPERAMQTTDRAEYEASFVLDRLRAAVGQKPLAAIIGEGMRRAEGRDLTRDDTPSRVLTADEVIERVNTPSEKRSERQAEREKAAKDFAATRDVPEPGRQRDNGKDGGRGGRGGKGR